MAIDFAGKDESTRCTGKHSRALIGVFSDRPAKAMNELEQEPGWKLVTCIEALRCVGENYFP